MSLDHSSYHSVTVVLKWHFKDVMEILRKMMAFNDSEFSEYNSF